MSGFKYIAIACILTFFALLFFTKADRNRLYIKSVILAYPFINMKVIPQLDTLFMMTIPFFFFFYKTKNLKNSILQIYRVAVFLLFLFIGIGFFITDFGPSLQGFEDLIRIIPFFIFTRILIEESYDDPHYVHEVIGLLKTALLMSFVFLCIQFVVGPQFSFSKNLNPNIVITNGVRYPSFFGDPQDYAQFLAILAFLSLMKPVKESGLPVINYLYFTLCILAILSAGGRAGLMGFLVGLSFFVLMSNMRVKLIMVGSGLLFYVVVMNFQDYFSIFKRGTSLDDTYDFRHGLWMNAFNMFLDNPIFGIGIGNYARYVEIFHPDQFWPIGPNEYIIFDVPESGYFKILSEWGGPAFVLVFFMLLFPMIRGFFLFFKYWDYSLVLLISAFASFIIGFNSNYSFSDSRILLLICILVSFQIILQHHLAVTVHEGDVDLESEKV